MISDSLVSGSLSKSMGPSVGHTDGSQVENKRKRHRSAGDHLNTKTRSNSLFSNWRHRHLNGVEKGMKFSELMAKEESELVETESGDEMKGIAEEIKDSGVDLDENIEVGTSSVDNFDIENVGVLLENEDRVNENGEIDGAWSEEKQQHKVGISEEKLESISEVKSRKGSLKSVTSSPLHVNATPVTENDPLGHFVESQGEAASSGKEKPKSSPEKNREKFVETRPFANELKLRKGLEKLDLGKCNSEETSSSDEASRVNNSYGRTLGKIMSPVEKVQKSLFKIERTSSFPENLGNQGACEGEKRKPNVDRSDIASLGRSSTSLTDQRPEIGTPKSDFRLFRTGSFRRHKENFSGMLKFATGAVANKLTEIKMSMTPSKLGSNTSLTPSYDDVDSEDEAYREAARKRGSLDFLHRSIDRLDTSSINGGQGMYAEPKKHGLFRHTSFSIKRKALGHDISGTFS